MTSSDDGRMPPAAEAEQAVLGAMMLSPAAADACLRALTAADFHRPAHRLVFDAVRALAGDGGAADRLTVAARLEQDGRLAAAGGAAYLAGLEGVPPDLSRAGDYARIVRDAAVRRRVAAAGQAITRLAAEPGDAGGLAERAVREAEAARAEGQAGEVSARSVDEFLADGTDEYDWLIEGLLERGDRMMLTGFEGFGKALALDTPVPTPKGWTAIGEIAPGDEVFGADGFPARVIAATETMHGRPCYRVTFSDGGQVIADAAHQWLTRTLACREKDARQRRRGPLKPRGTDQRHKRAYFPAVVTTRQIRRTLLARDGHCLNHSVDTCGPLQYPAQHLPVDPYLLGAWLGDGHSAGNRITCHADDIEIIEHIRATGLTVRKMDAPSAWALGDGNYKGMDRPGSITARLRGLGVLGDKHIPDLYKFAAIDQRLALLQGLMDTDGTIGAAVRGAVTCEFSVCSERLARDVHELLLGLGIKVTFREGRAVLEGRYIGQRYRLSFHTDLPVFRLSRKAARLAPLRTQRARLRYITAADPVDPVPVRCIQVDREDGLFLVGRECIPTHNSTLLDQVAVMAAAGLHPFTWKAQPPVRVLIIDCENGARRKRRSLRPLVLQAARQGYPVAETNLWVEVWEDVVDLAADRDVSRLLRCVAATGPDIVQIGPLTKLAPRALHDDTDAAPVLAALNMVRARGACVLVEAHAGHGLGAGGRRDMRPRGSSAFLGWPEFGYGIRPAEVKAGDGRRVADVVPWRGDRDERDWPSRLVSGGVWPWSADGGWTPSSVLG